MTTKQAVDGYFHELRNGRQWAQFLADDVVFTSFTTPAKRIAGKGAFVDATQRFYSMIDSVEVRDLIIDGDHACALTRYQLQPPIGAPFVSDVAELFTVKNGVIDTFSIYFDSAPYPKR